jgi:ATP-dependent exoDNAse (exonuclease V) alpha subunit
LLEFDSKQGRFTRNENRPLDADLVVVDETSMVDVPLMHSLLRAHPPKAALILVGDVDLEWAIPQAPHALAKGGHVLELLCAEEHCQNQIPKRRAGRVLHAEPGERQRSS